MPLSPLHEDAIVTTAAAAMDAYPIRRRVVKITDQRAVIEAGFVREVIDYGKLRKLLEDGYAVDGAELSNDYEYILRKSEGSDE